MIFSIFSINFDIFENIMIFTNPDAAACTA